jgi:hypothetical protein
LAAEQINIKPLFEQTKVPCDGEAGDLLVLTPLKEGDTDPNPQGVAQLWFCIKSGKGERHAVWVRVSFDGFATCDTPLPLPPQNRPPVRREG